MWFRRDPPLWLGGGWPSRPGCWCCFVLRHVSLPSCSCCMIELRYACRRIGLKGRRTAWWRARSSSPPRSTCGKLDAASERMVQSGRAMFCSSSCFVGQAKILGPVRGLVNKCLDCRNHQRCWKVLSHRCRCVRLRALRISQTSGDRFLYNLPRVYGAGKGSKLKAL